MRMTWRGTGALCRDHRHRNSTFSRWLALAGGFWLLALAAPAQSFTVRYAFGAGRGGENPANLMLGTNGYFYGGAVNGGSNDWGAIYQMTTSGTPTPLYSFKESTSDGANPFAGLTQGTNGLFYGMSETGGTNGSGIIFQVKSNGTFTPLYAFSKQKAKGSTGLITNADGDMAGYALVLGANGNFYGTAEAGGTNGYGTVFEMTHQGKVTALYSFSNSVDGAEPLASLLQFTNGILYGTTASGGSNGVGTVFQVTAAGRVTPIYSFIGDVDGATPEAPLINGHDGNLYGTCTQGGQNGTGTIFKITTNGVLTLLYSFTAGNSETGVTYNADGINPKSLLLGADGNFYGVAYNGGANGSGSIFQFTQSGSLNVLYAFTYWNSELNGGVNSDGANPISLTQAPDGNLYGTAYEGSSNSYGAFFRVGVPPSITIEPTNQCVALHSNASFSVTASGAPACQWQFNSANLNNATNYTLSITNAQIANAGSYQAIVTNVNGATTSSVVTLNITNVPVSFCAAAGAIQYSGGQFSLQLTNLTGQGAVVIEASTDLKQWTPIYTNVSGFGAAEFIDSNAGNYPFRFYRATTP